MWSHAKLFVMLFLGLASGCAGTVAVAETANPAPTGRFLHLSDIHFDPYYDPTLVSRLAAAPADQWEGIFASSAIDTLSHGHVDSNFPLLKSALEAAQTEGPYDYILYSGDYLRHHFQSAAPPRVIADPTAFAVKAVNFVNLMLERHFPGVPIIAALGNNDSAIGDYQLEPGGPFLAGLGPEMPVLSGNPAALQQFEAGGYYRIPHPTIADHDFLVLSIFWSRDYDYGCASGSPSLQPGADQLRWLAAALDANTNDVSLLMHIPPGMDGHSGYQRRGDADPMWCGAGNFEAGFQQLLAPHRHRLRGAYAGHTHMDEFRVLSDGTAYLALRVAPSISSYNGNRPAFTVATYDTSTGAMLDYTTMALINIDDGITPDQADWQQGYRFGASYGASDYSPATLARVADAIRRSGSPAQTAFGDNYASGAPNRAEDSRYVEYFACALDAMTEPDYDGCLD